MRFALKLCALLVLIAGGATVARADGDAPPSTEDAQVANLADAKWKPAAKPHEAVMLSPIAVDPATKASIAYAKFPAGYKFPTHWHTAAEYSVLLSGKATFTLEGKEHPMVPGSYIVIPGKTRHSLVCDAGAECLVLTRRGGPTDYHWEDAK
jgi:quercetin dioxygenase-like cupin family protein